VVEPVLELAVEVYEVVVLCACAGMTARRPTAAKTTIAATFRAVGLPMPMFTWDRPSDALSRHRGSIWWSLKKSQNWMGWSSYPC